MVLFPGVGRAGENLMRRFQTQGAALASRNAGMSQTVMTPRTSKTPFQQRLTSSRRISKPKRHVASKFQQPLEKQKPSSLDAAILADSRNNFKIPFTNINPSRGIYEGSRDLGNALTAWIPSNAKMDATIVNSRVPSVLKPATSNLTHFGRGVLKAPGETVKYLGMAPVATEYIVRNPQRSARDLAPAAASTADGMVTAAKEDPFEFAGLVAGSALTTKGIRAAPGAMRTGVRAGVRFPAEATGIVRKKTFGYTKGERIPYMSPAEEVQTIFESPRISGVRATPKPAGQFLPTRHLRVRNPALIGDVGAGESAGTKGAFATISRPEFEPHGTYFHTKKGGLFGSLAGKRVYLHEGIRTVQIPETLKQGIYSSIRTKGQFKGPQYDQVLRLAKQQSIKYKEPVAVPSPKRAAGVMQPENEMFLVFGSKEATKIAQTKWAGFTPQGTIVKRIRYGNQPKITTGRLASMGENLKYNWDVGRSGLKFYNKNYLRAMSRDMGRKTSELYDGALSYPGSYGGHGKLHAQGVSEGMLRQMDLSPKLRSEMSPQGAWLRGKYHDIAKIYDGETQPMPHSFAAGEAIRTGMFKPPDLAGLPKAERIALGKDIATHTDIMPGWGRRGILTKAVWRPSHAGMALATADRLDLSRFGVNVNSRKTFPIPERRLGFRVQSLTEDVISGRRDIPIGLRTKVVPESAGWPPEAIRMAAAGKSGKKPSNPLSKYPKVPAGKGYPLLPPYSRPSSGGYTPLPSEYPKVPAGKGYPLLPIYSRPSSGGYTPLPSEYPKVPATRDYSPIPSYSWPSSGGYTPLPSEYPKVPATRDYSPIPSYSWPSSGGYPSLQPKRYPGVFSVLPTTLNPTRRLKKAPKAPKRRKKRGGVSDYMYAEIAPVLNPKDMLRLI